MKYPKLIVKNKVQILLELMSWVESIRLPK